MGHFEAVGLATEAVRKLAGHPPHAGEFFADVDR